MVRWMKAPDRGDEADRIKRLEKEVEFLYAEGDLYTFMDTTTFEQYHLTREQLGAIALRETFAADVSSDQIARALLDDALARGLEQLPWSKAATQLRERVDAGRVPAIVAVQQGQGTPEASFPGRVSSTATSGEDIAVTALSDPATDGAGQVWEREKELVSFERVRITPGIGLRFATPLGPVRLDVAYNGYDPEEGPLYFRDDATGVVTLLDAAYRLDAPSTFTDRLVLQFAVGQAF